MDKFKYSIDVKNMLTDFEKETIIQLYQPILGLNSCQIFFTLILEGKMMTSLSEKAFSFDRLEKLFNLDAKNIKNQIKRLEGMNLIKTFLNKQENKITYKIQKPLTPEQFFSNVLFNGMLKTKLDELSYEMIRVFYMGEKGLVDQETSQEITTNFQQAFPEVYKTVSKDKVVKKLTKKELKAKEMDEFDPNEYVEQLLECKPKKTVLNVIKNLKDKFSLNKGTINCLLDFSYWKNNGRIVGSYLYKIAESLNSKGIKTTVDVMNYLRNVKRYANGEFTNNNPSRKKIIKTKISDFSNDNCEKLCKEDGQASLQWLKEQMENDFDDDSDLVQLTNIRINNYK